MLSGKTARVFSRVIFFMKKRLSSTQFAVLSFIASAGASVWAQSALPEVVVVASRFAESKFEVPVSVQIITREDIQNSAAMTLPDALRMLAGVNVRSIAGGQLGVGSSVDLGGFGATATQNTLVLLDGRRLNPIDSSEVNWSGVPLSSIQRIEVSAGGAGVQYGAGSSGGVIHIITDGKVVDKTLAAVQAGSFGTAQVNLQVDRQLGDLAFKLNTGVDHSDGWRENSQVRGQNLSFKVQKDLQGGNQIFGEMVYSDGTHQFPGGVVGLVGEGNQQAAKFNNVGSQNSVRQNGVRFGGLANLASHTVLETDLYFGNKNSVFKKPYSETVTTSAPSNGSNLDGAEISFSPKLRTEFANGASLVLGFDYSKSNQDSNTSYGVLAQQYILTHQGTFPWSYKGNLVADSQSVQLQNQAAYFLARLPMSSQLEFSLGARRQVQSFDSYDLNTSVGHAQTAAGSFSANAHEAGVNFKVDASNRLYARANQTYRFANTDEYWGYDPITYNRVFSGELRPQIGKGVEIGYDFHGALQSFGLVAGQSLSQNEIRYDANTGNNLNWADDIFRSSLTANWSVQVLSKGHFTANIRWQRAEYANGTHSGQTLGHVPSVIQNFGWVQELDNGSRLGLQVTHVSAQNYDASPDDIPTLKQMPDYTTADLFWSRTYGKLGARMTVKNLLGETYAPYGGYGFVSLPGGANGYRYYYYPSDPRSVYLSLSYQF